MSVYRLSERSGGVIGTIGPIGGSGVFSLQERYALTADNYENVSLYLKMNGANGSTTFYDSSLNNFTVTANGNAQISTAQSKFGGASAAFDGTGDWLEVPSSPDLNFGEGDFTIEGWVYPTANNTFAGIVSKSTENGTDGFTFNIDSGNLALKFGGSSYSGGAVSLNTWSYVTATRSGSSFKLFLNGTQVVSGTDSYNTDTSGSFRVGAARSPTSSNNLFNGYIDDLRITKGVARYTSNFTPPQREFLP